MSDHVSPARVDPRRTRIVVALKDLVVTEPAGEVWFDMTLNGRQPTRWPRDKQRTQRIQQGRIYPINSVQNIDLNETEILEIGGRGRVVFNGPIDCDPRFDFGPETDTRFFGSDNDRENYLRGSLNESRKFVFGDGMTLRYNTQIAAWLN